MERREAPGACEAPLADLARVRRAPLRRRAHPSDVGMRRLPVLHRDAGSGATFSPRLAAPLRRRTLQAERPRRNRFMICSRRNYVKRASAITG